MAKFNVVDHRVVAKGPIETAARPTGSTYEGAPGYARTLKSELFLLAVANMVGEQTFYEGSGDRDERYRQLVRQVAIDDPLWTVGLLRWLRSDGNMRSASLVGAAEFVKARLDAKLPSVPAYEVPGLADDRGLERAAVDLVCQRADEPGEMLAYWTSRYGRAIPKPVKRGVADAVERLYTERALLKYDGASKGYRFGDVIDLVHPSSAPGSWQADLYRHALDRRHNRANGVPDSLTMIRRNALLRSEGEPTDWLSSSLLQEAGMTWEDALSAVGSKVDKARLWEALIPSMGYMGLLRNVRNFDQAGVSDETAATVAVRLADPVQVAKSRQFPFRFLAAYRAAPSLRWGHALDTALTASLANVPQLAGRTLVLVDRSGSMFGRMSERSELTSADAAAVFGAAVALRNVGRTDLVQFGSGSAIVPTAAGDSLLRTVERFGNLGGTETAAAVRQHYHGHDRVLIVTDEQAWAGYGDPAAAVPPSVPVYTWNLVGYQHGHGPGVENRHTFAGLTDAAFRMVPLLEAGRSGAWPWESRETVGSPA